MDYLPFTPQLGAEGPLITSPPIDNIIKPGVSYTVVAIRKIGEVITSGEDVYNTVYLPLYLSREDYIRDLANDISLITLQDSLNKKYKIPSSYILGFPVTSGVKYQDNALVINLGGLPIDFELEVLTNAIKETLIEKLGIDTEVHKTNLSRVYYLSEDQDTIFRRRILYRKESWVSDKVRLALLQEQYNKQKEVLRKLESFITLMGRNLNLCGDPCPQQAECPDVCNPIPPIDPIDPSNPPPLWPPGYPQPGTPPTDPPPMVDCITSFDPDICVTVLPVPDGCTRTKVVVDFMVNNDVLIDKDCIKQKCLDDTLYVDHDIKIRRNTVPDCDPVVKVLLRPLGCDDCEC